MSDRPRRRFLMSIWFLVAAVMGPRGSLHCSFWSSSCEWTSCCTAFFGHSDTSRERGNPQGTIFVSERLRAPNYNLIRYALVQVFTSSLSAREFGQRFT